LYLCLGNLRELSASKFRTIILEYVSIAGKKIA